MTNQLNSIPPLIPLPSSQPNPDPEFDIDKFATLFNPQTPPASPDLPPIFTQSKPTASIRSASFRLTHKHGLPSGRSDKDSPALSTPGSADSEFGCFVSVPPAQDPLSESFFPSSPPGSSQFGSITAPIPSAGAGLSISSSTSSPNSTQAPTPKPAPPFQHTTRTHTRNPSLDFFGKFVEDAKKKEMTGLGRGYLDELLKHEDDPLYWVKADGGADNHDEGDGKIDGQHADGAIRLDTEVSLLDLDSDIPFATSGNDDGNGIENGHTTEQKTTTKLPELPAKPKLKPFATPSLSPAFPVSSRSPPHSQPPPRPISTQPTTSKVASGHEPHPLLDATSPLVRSSSSSSISTSSSPPYNSLTSLSSRWMSNLLSSSQPSAPSLDDHPSAQDIFPSTSTSSGDLPHPRQHPKTQSSLPSPSAISTLRPRHSPSFPFTSFTTPGTSSIPSTSITSSAPSTISHGSPFGSRLFIPPSGAPGFAGDSAWDKGFSNDYFDNERVDRKSVRLEGRREMTSSVLEMELVDLIRPHLPALARLPRTWSLLYSLDQHGISLNTLYTRCEPQAPASSQPKGSLVVMKDSGDAIFGVWLGEGLRVSKGSYYGSGESFLWRYVGGKLDVYKWTGKNDYVALCEPEYLSFGGGDGRYGLYLDDTLLDGSSAYCPTFENEPLCSPGTKKGGNVTFECVGLEVWAVGPT